MFKPAMMAISISLAFGSFPALAQKNSAPSQKAYKLSCEERCRTKICVPGQFSGMGTVSSCMSNCVQKCAIVRAAATSELQPFALLGWRRKKKAATLSAQFKTNRGGRREAVFLFQHGGMWKRPHRLELLREKRFDRAAPGECPHPILSYRKAL